MFRCIIFQMSPFRNCHFSDCPFQNCPPLRFFLFRNVLFKISPFQKYHTFVFPFQIYHFQFFLFRIVVFQISPFQNCPFSPVSTSEASFSRCVLFIFGIVLFADLPSSLCCSVVICSEVSFSVFGFLEVSFFRVVPFHIAEGSLSVVRHVIYIFFISSHIIMYIQLNTNLRQRRPSYGYKSSFWPLAGITMVVIIMVRDRNCNYNYYGARQKL